MNAVGSLLFQTLLLYSSLQIEHILTAALQKKMGVWPSLNSFPPPSSFCLAAIVQSLLPAVWVIFPLKAFASHLSRLALPSLAHSCTLFPSALSSPTRWKTHLSNTGRSPRHLSSSPVAKNRALLCKQVCQDCTSSASCSFFFSSLSRGGRSNSCWVSAWQNQLWFFEASAQICHPKNVNYQEGLLIPGSSNHSSPTMSSPDLHFGELVVVCVKFLQLKLKWRQSVNPQGCTGWITFCHLTAAWMPIQPWVAVAWHSLVDGPLMLLQSLEQHAKEEVEETEEVEE